MDSLPFALAFCALLLLAIFAATYCRYKKNRKRVHRHLNESGAVVFVDPADGFADCQCGGGFEYRWKDGFDPAHGYVPENVRHTGLNGRSRFGGGGGFFAFWTADAGGDGDCGGGGGDCGGTS